MLGGARKEELGNFRAPLQHNDLIWRQDVAQDHFLLKRRICCPKIWPVGFQNIPPAKFHFGISIILNCRYLKNSKCRERISLNSPSAWRQILQKKLNCHQLSSWEVHQPGRTDLSQEPRSQHHTQENSLTNYLTSPLFFSGPTHLS